MTLSDGSTVRADLVVGADGPHSAVRRLAFGPEERFVKPLGGYHAWFTAPDHVGLDGWFLMYQAPPGINASMRPSHDPAIAKAGLAFRAEPIEYDRHDLDAQRQLLIDRMAGAGWQTDALLAAAAHADDFYFDAFAQVHMDSWSQGRVTLVGDAGYCASPLSGMGTSLALVGAYLLAGELGPAPTQLSTAHVERALRGYAARMRPYVDRCQDLPARGRRLRTRDQRRHRRHPTGDEVDAALAVSTDRGQEVVHHRRCDRPAGLRARRRLADVADHPTPNSAARSRKGRRTHLLPDAIPIIMSRRK